MKVYVDSDVAVKLAQWGLLKRFTQHLSKQGKADLYTVSTLRYRFKLSEKYKAAELVGSMAAVEQLIEFVSACQAPLGHNQKVAEALIDVPSIDAGEAALFAAAANYDAALVDTGDKNAIRAVGALAAKSPVVMALHGKLACLEQTMHYLAERWSFAVVSAAVASYPSADKATARCFSDGDEASAMGALSAKIFELKPHCGALLADKPFDWIS